jgi:hypothetical protein
LIFSFRAKYEAGACHQHQAANGRRARPAVSQRLNKSRFVFHNDAIERSTRFRGRRASLPTGSPREYKTETARLLKIDCLGPGPPLECGGISCEF